MRTEAEQRKLTRERQSAELRSAFRLDIVHPLQAVIVAMAGCQR